MTDPLSAGLAVRATSQLANSARPDSPVLDDLTVVTPRNGDRLPRPAQGTVRRRAASGLRRLADRLEPAHATATGH